MRIVIALGGNRGERAGHLARALRSLEAAGVHVLAVSRMQQTAPVEATGRRSFLNAVALAETRLLPRVLLARLRQIERAAGRRRWPDPHGRKPPRPLDLDLILYGRARISRGPAPGLTVPHPRFVHRAFVLAPLAELAPALHPPGQPFSVRQLARLQAGRAPKG